MKLSYEWLFITSVQAAV